MLVKVMIFLLSPSPPPQLSRGGAFTPEGRKGACECLVSQVGGSLCVLGSWSLCSRQQCQEMQQRAAGSGPCRHSGLTLLGWHHPSLEAPNPWTPMSLPAPHTLSKDSAPEGHRCHVLWPMEGGPLAFLPTSSPNHSSSPSFQALMNSWDAYSGHCEVSLSSESPAARSHANQCL